MEPTEAWRRVAHYAAQGTGVKVGYYPAPGTLPNPPCAVVYWIGVETTYRGGLQEMLLTGEIRLLVADANQAEKVVGQANRLALAIIDRFRPDRANPAYTLAMDGEEGSVKHCHVARGGDNPRPAQTDVYIDGWGAKFYGAVFPVEIKLTREPEQIV